MENKETTTGRGGCDKAGTGEKRKTYNLRQLKHRVPAQDNEAVHPQVTRAIQVRERNKLRADLRPRMKLMWG